MLCTLEQEGCSASYVVFEQNCDHDHTRRLNELLVIWICSCDDHYQSMNVTNSQPDRMALLLHTTQLLAVVLIGSNI